MHALLDAAWISRQLAWESVWSVLPAAEAFQRTRPYVGEFLEEAVPLGASVIDLGGGTGVVSRLVAKRASRVLYVDSSPTNAGIARQECKGVENVAFEIGEALSVLGAHGPFDVALMLHILGFEEDPIGWLKTARAHVARAIIEVPDLDAEPLNRVRLKEARPCYHDQLYVVEFSRDTLQTCLEASGWRVAKIDARDGALLALADA
jgi:predicted RNA methylase